MIKRSSLFFLFSFLGFISYSQVGFERLYPVNMTIEHLTLDGMNWEDGYVKLALTTQRDSAIYKSANITKLDSKGDIAWSRDLVVEDSLEFLLEGDLLAHSSGNLVSALSGIKDSLSQFIVLTDEGGNVQWAKRYAIYQDSSSFEDVKPRLAESFVDNHIYYANKGLSQGKEAIFISKVNASNGEMIWSNYIESPDNDLIFGSISACMEGGVMVAAIDASTQQYFVSKLDENGNILFNKSLQTGVTPNNSFANSLIQLQDSTYVLAGSYFVGVEYDGYVLKLDSLADVEWAKKIDFDFSSNDVYLLDLVEDTKGDILMSAKQIGVLDTAAFGLKLTQQGDVVWQAKYKENAVDNVQLGGLGLSWTGGMSYFLTGGNVEEQYISYLIAADSTGMTLCNDTIDQNIVFDASFNTDTLELNNNEFLSAYILECCDAYSTYDGFGNNTLVSSKVFGGNVYTCSYRTNLANDRVASFNKFDLSGNLIWSYEMISPSRFTNFHETEDGGIIVIGMTEPNTDNIAIMLKFDSDGNVVKQQQYDSPGRNQLRYIVRHPNPQNADFPYYVSGFRNPINNNPSTLDETILFNLDQDLNINWINNYATVSDTQTDGIFPTADGNLVMYGDSGSTYEAIFHNVNGADGSVILSRSSLENNDFNDLVQLSNGNYLACGSVRQADVTTFYGLVSLLDADLNVLSTNYFEQEEISAFRNLTIINDNNFFVTSTGLDGEGIIMRYEIDLNQELNLAQVSSLQRPGLDSNPYLDFDNGTFVLSEGGSDALGRGDFVVGIGSESDLFACLMDTSLTSQTYSYSFDTVQTQVMLDTFGVDTASFVFQELSWDQNEYCLYQEFTDCADVQVSSMAFAMYQVPVLTLEIRPFCPNEPIDWTFDATTNGAVSYLWQNEDGDTIGTADTLQVFETGMYNVIVTMGEDVCYTLCDTATLETFEEPTLSIAQNASILCETGELILIATPNAEAGVDSIFWSTGESGNTINVSQPGQVVATVVDNCGLQATASFDPDFDILEMPQVTILVDDSAFCDQGVYQLTAVPNGTTTPFESFMWSTNETSNPIFVSSGGTYGVTILDECSLEATATVDVADFPVLVSDISIDVGESTICSTDPFTLEVIINPSNAADLEIFWTTGGTQNITTISEGGNYGVSVTDFCDNFYTDEIEIEEFPSLVTDPSTRPEFIQVDTLCATGESQLTLVGFIDQAYSINWSNGETNVESIIVPADEEPYSVELIDECGNTFTYNANAGECDQIQFPNVFTPEDQNMDGRNIRFGPVGSPAGVENYELNVFNRWGEKVFESTDPTESWDGMYKDKNQASDVYMWYASYTWFGIDYKDKGSVTLVR